MTQDNKINSESCENDVKIITNEVIDEMHVIFTKHQKNEKGSVVDDFIKSRRQES